MSTRKPAAMILPPHEFSSGELVGYQYRFGHDARVPSPLRDQAHEAHTPGIVAHYHRPPQCPDGRHLWDIIESTIFRELEDDTAESGWREEIEFRAHLTCVRCGLIRSWEGIRDGATRDPAPVNPVPLTAGDLVAQQVKGGESWGGRDMSCWDVYRAGVQVGSITWACGPRGRAYHVGRLNEWTDGQTVEATDPPGVLRKLSRTQARAAS